MERKQGRRRSRHASNCLSIPKACQVPTSHELWGLFNVCLSDGGLEYFSTRPIQGRGSGNQARWLPRANPFTSEPVGRKGWDFARSMCAAMVQVRVPAWTSDHLCRSAIGGLGPAFAAAATLTLSCFEASMFKASMVQRADLETRNGGWDGGTRQPCQRVSGLKDRYLVREINHVANQPPLV